MSMLGNATHVDGFRKEYYITVQFNMIERGIYDKSQYDDLYIERITTDPTMQSSCHCCSDEKDGKIQHIMYRFHVKNRKDPDFEMIFGSTCISQFKGVDPDMLRHALLTFEQEKKKVDKLRRKNAVKDRIADYKVKYAHFIHYLDRLKELKRGFSAQPIRITVKNKSGEDVVEKTSMYEIYEILCFGKKVFREHHELAFARQVEALPLSEIEQQIEERVARRNGTSSQIADFQKQKEAEAEAERERQQKEAEALAEQERQQKEAALLVEQDEQQRNADLTLVNEILVAYPNEEALKTMKELLEDGENLIEAQHVILTRYKEQMSAGPSLLDRVEAYLSVVNNSTFMKNMQGLLQRKVTLTDVQLKKIDEVIECLTGFEEKYKQSFSLLELIGKRNLSATNHAKYLELMSTYTKARPFSKFYTERLEQTWKKGIEDLAKATSLSTIF